MSETLGMVGLAILVLALLAALIGGRFARARAAARRLRPGAKAAIAAGLLACAVAVTLSSSALLGVVWIVMAALGLFVVLALLGLIAGLIVGVPWILYALLWAGFRARLYPIAARNLLQHRRRTAALGAAIAAVTALLVVLLGLTAGVRQTMLTSATTLVSGHLNVGGFYKISAGMSAPLVTDWEEVEGVVKRSLANIDYVAPRGRGYAKVISETGASVQTGLAGIEPAREPGFRKVVQLVAGNLDELTQLNTILLFEEHAKKLDVKVGDVVTVAATTLRGASNTVDARVVAIAKNIGLMSQFSSFMGEDTIREIYRLKPNATGAIHVYLKDLENLPAVAAKLRQDLAAAGYGVMEADPNVFWMKFEKVNRETWTGQKLDVTTWEDEIAFVRWVIRALDAVVYVLILVLIVIIAVGIMNTLWIAIRERTREIGTLRAIGMQRRYVLATFVIEAFSLSLVATVVGAAAGLGLCVLLDALDLGVPLVVQLFLMSDTLTFNLEVGDSVRSVALIAFCMTFVSLIPSYLAARMKPITAMHHIG